MTDTQNAQPVSAVNASAIQPKESGAGSKQTEPASFPAFSRSFDYGFSDIAYCDDE